MPDESRRRIAAELAERLRQVTRPYDGRPLVEEVWEREQAFAGPFEAFGPDLSMVLADSATMSILPSEALVARRPEVRGHHRWQGVFVASGPGIRPAATVDELSIVDVAPLLLHRLGLPVPDDMAGRLPTEVLEADELERHPPQRAPAAAGAAAAYESIPFELEPDEEVAVLERLRALGYVE